MPQFSYVAKIGPDKTKTGTIFAENPQAVVRKLREDGLYPITIEEIIISQKKDSSGWITQQDISQFTRLLANLVYSAVPLSQALLTVKRQIHKTAMIKLVEQISQKIEKGATFSEALAVFPNLFSSFYISMVRIGETSGQLEKTLERLADFKEKELETQAQVKAALVYPTFLIVIGILMIVILMTFFVPKILNIFTEMNQFLPLPTQILIFLSRVLTNFWWIILLFFLIAIILISQIFKSEKKRVWLDEFLLRIPILKDLLVLFDSARFSYALGILLESGIPMLNALSVVTLSINNRAIRKKISRFTEYISKGMSLSSCFQQESIFPPIITTMVLVGEESGTLTDMLFRMAKTFENESNRLVRSFVSLLEPTLVLLIGSFVVLIVFAILLPIFQLEIFNI
ncbi:MAG: type II secretion system F family protein [Candidatus Omnitrophica bacterium]|nr:type II secretion system F family protein [Candidatus Omnitrophota bacterium]